MDWLESGAASVSLTMLDPQPPFEDAVAAKYISAVMHRVKTPLPPDGFEPDWADAPRDAKTYPGAHVYPLPPASSDRTSSPESRLSQLLRFSYGRLSRRLTINANDLPAGMARYGSSRWGRGVASGGGRYPVGIYVFPRQSTKIPRGIYHYSPDHHGLHELVLGDFEHLLGVSPSDADFSFALSVKFWQSAFKYANFSYFAVAMDVGTLLQAWASQIQVLGASLSITWWLDESALARAIGVDPLQEGIFAVAHVSFSGFVSGPRSPANRRQALLPRASTATLRPHENEKSRVQHSFGYIVGLQQDALSRQAAGPVDLARAAIKSEEIGGAKAIQLPDACRPREADPFTLLSRRISSFGRMSGDAIGAAELSNVLSNCVRTPPLLIASALGGSATAHGLTSVYVVALRVDGIAPGIYEYLSEANQLRCVADGDFTTFVQDNYFLTNYQARDAAAVIVPVARPEVAAIAAGTIGIRVVNAVIGSLAQRAYQSCASLDLACGAALGFETTVYKDALKLRDDEEPMIVLFIGRARDDAATFRFELT